MGAQQERRCPEARKAAEAQQEKAAEAQQEKAAEAQQEKAAEAQHLKGSALHRAGHGEFHPLQQRMDRHQPSAGRQRKRKQKQRSLYLVRSLQQRMDRHQSLAEWPRRRKERHQSLPLTSGSMIMSRKGSERSRKDGLPLSAAPQEKAAPFSLGPYLRLGLEVRDRLPAVLQNPARSVSLQLQ